MALQIAALDKPAKGLAMRLNLSVFGLSMLVLTGCGGENLSEEPSIDATIEVEIEPNPPIVGDNLIRIVVKDSAGDALEGATITVDPQMPNHGHGSPKTAEVEEIGNGQYKASPVHFSMPGNWEVTVKLSTQEGSASDIFSYDVSGKK